VSFVIGGSAPATLGFNAFGPEWLACGATSVAPAFPAAESALGSHPCVALSSARVLPEWTLLGLASNAFSANGDYPLNFVSQNSAHCKTLRLWRGMGSLMKKYDRPAGFPVGWPEVSSSCTFYLIDWVHLRPAPQPLARTTEPDLVPTYIPPAD
jgi:hypothetical protein